MSVWHLNLGEHWTPDNTTQHLSNFHPSPALLQPGDTLSRLICLSATEIVVDIRDLLVTVTWVWPVSVCNVEHVTVVTRHTTHQDLVTLVTAPVTRWLHISIHCLPVLCCKHAHTALHVPENWFSSPPTFIFISSRAFCKAIFIVLSNWFIIPILMSAA